MRGPDIAPGSDALVGIDGNAGAISGFVTSSLRNAGADSEFTDAVRKDMFSGNYDHLLGVAMQAMDGEYFPEGAEV